MPIGLFADSVDAGADSMVMGALLLRRMRRSSRIAIFGSSMIERPAYILATIVVYMGVCLLLGFIAWRRTSTLSDFILGGRSLGSWVTAFSAQATDMSGWLLMGLPGLAYASGFDAVWMAGGLIVGTWANWRFIARPLRVRTEQLNNALTLPDYFEYRFADAS